MRCRDELISGVADNGFDGVLEVVVAMDLFEEALRQWIRIYQFGRRYSESTSGKESGVTYPSAILSEHQDISSTGPTYQSLDWVDRTSTSAHKLHGRDLAPPIIRLADVLRKREGSGLLDGPY